VQNLHVTERGKTKAEKLTFKKIRDYILHSDTLSPIFWKLWFWWGIRQAMKERKLKEAEDAKREPMSNDDYWDMVHRRKQND